MEWQSLGFTENPFTTEPIRQDTIGLYAGRQENLEVCENVLSENIDLRLMPHFLVSLGILHYTRKTNF